jgi:6-phosphogluconolactonase
MTRTRSSLSILAIGLALSATGFGPAQAVAQPPSASSTPPHTIYTETNAAAGNAVLAFHDNGRGTLTPVATYLTGALGSGDSLGSQGAVSLSPDEKFLFAVNAGSDSVSAFRVSHDGSLRRLGQIASGGDRPISVTAAQGVGYVLNATSLNVSGFTYGAPGIRSAHHPATRSLSPGAAGPAQVRLTPNGHQVVVTEKSSNSLDVFAARSHGRLGRPQAAAVTGSTPFGFDFTARGVAVVSEAGTASAESFRVRRDGTARSVDIDSNGGQAAPCWLVVTRDGIAFTANAGATANSLSSFRVGTRGDLFLLHSVAASTDPHPTDMALGSHDTRLYNLSDSTGNIDASTIGESGSLSGTSAVVTGLPTTIVGLAATNR